MTFTSNNLMTIILVDMSFLSNIGILINEMSNIIYPYCLIMYTNFACRVLIEYYLPTITVNSY